MKKLSFFLMAMLLTLCVTNAWAADSTVTFGTAWNTVFGTSYNGSFNPAKNALTLTGTIDAVTLTATNGTSTSGYVKTSDWRLYNGYTLTIAVQEGNAISKITAQKGGKTITGIKANEGNLEIPSGGASMTWTGNTNEVVFSISATMGFSEISVTYSATGSTSKETTSLTWSADAYAATIGAENTFPTLTTDPVDLEGVTYSSSNVAAATIAADGTITLVAPGTTNITASFAGNETHYAATAASYKLTVKNSLENAVPYELHTGNLVEGDYVVFYANNGMKAQVVSNRLSYTEYIPEADVIYDPSADDVWHISKNGDYWTLYNAATAKYAAGNGTKNQAALVDNVGDAALWTATMTDGTFEFVNKKNNDASVNKNLRYNAGYGFACYGTSTGGALSLYKKVVANDAVTSPIISGNAEFVESTEVTIVAEDGLKVYYTLDGTDPTNASTEYTAPFELTATTTVKAVAYDGEKASDIISKTFKQLQVLTCEEAAELCAATESADKYVIRGYVTNIATAWSDQYSNISFWMADTKDGGKVFEAFRVQPIIAAEKSVKVGDYVEVIGKIVLYGTTPETTQGGTYTIIPAPVVNHTIAVSANPAEGGVVTGGDEYEEGATAILTATPNEGYEFVNWTENEVEVSTDAEYTFEVLADRSLVANFKKAAPATETVYFINAKNWAKVNVYAWNAGGNNGWPGKAATKEAEQIAGYDVYSFTANAGEYDNVIFNDGSSQTPDLVWTAGKYYVVDMGWLTKEEAETELAAPLPEVWTIVGAAGLMGKDWDLNAAENAMTKQGDGTYKLVKTGITIVAGTYEYKAAKDHGWTVAVPQDGNQKLTISTSGTYDVTFVLDVTAKKLTATATLKQAAVVIPTIVIAGDMNGWNQTKDKFTMSADSLTATFKATLAVKNYGFKMIVGGAWHSDGKTITRAANSTKFTGANSNTNSTLKADIAGEYLFTWEYATKTLTVTYPALPVKYNVTVTAEHGTVTGAGEYEEGTEATLTAIPAEGYEFVNWTKGEDEVSTENPYTFTVSADVDLVANFKVAEPETITWELNGGKLPLVGPTNAELWEMFKPYYNTYYGLARADQPIDKVTTFASAYMQKIMTDPESEYKWLGDYVLEVAASQGLTLPTDMASANEGAWRWAVHAFFNANEGQYGATGADFTEAGKSENWVNVYPDAQEVVVPTEPVTEDYVLPTPVKEGCKFVGWYDNAEGTGEAMTVLPAGWAGTLYAIWKQGTTTALENIAVEGKAVKAIVNGQLIIIKNGVQYNAQGQVVK